MKLSPDQKCKGCRWLTPGDTWRKIERQCLVLNLIWNPDYFACVAYDDGSFLEKVRTLCDVAEKTADSNDVEMPESLERAIWDALAPVRTSPEMKENDNEPL